MSKGTREETIAKIIGATEPVLANEGFELVDLELTGSGNGTIVRFFIDKPGGVTVEDCATVSEVVDAILDVEDPIPSAYTLEVSSPGLDRPLRKPSDYAKYAGKRVKLKTYGPVPDCGDRKVFDGVLGGIADAKVTITVDGKAFVVPHASIAHAHLVWEPEASTFAPGKKKK